MAKSISGVVGDRFNFSAFFALGILLTAGSVLSGCSYESHSETLTYEYSDEVNGRSCTTGQRTFSSKSDYCSALKNEALNAGCAKVARKLEYQQTCGSDFPESSSPTAGPVPPPSNPRPPTTGPNPQPQPQPTAVPRPTATPDPINQYPPVVRELRDAGIEVEIYPAPIPLPTEEPFHVHLSRFWQVLESSKDRLKKLNQTAGVRRLMITDWADFASDKGFLSLSVSFSKDGLNKYLDYLDRRVKIEAATGVYFQFRIEVYGHRPDDFEKIDGLIRFFEGKTTELKQLSPLVRMIELYNIERFWLGNRVLKINEESFKIGFETNYLKLLPLTYLAASAEKFGIKLQSSGALDVLEHSAAFAEIIDQLDPDSLEAASGLVKSFVFAEYGTPYINSSGEMSIPVAGESTKIIGAILDSLVFEDRISAALGLPIERTMLRLEQPYVECIKRLKARVDAIRAVKSKLLKIRLKEYESDYSSGVLTVGAGGTLGDLDRAIEKIK